MFGRLYEWSRCVVPVFGLLSVLLAAGLARAAGEPDPITVDVPAAGIDFSGLVTQITGQLFPIMAAAGGLGLAIWIVSMLFNKFKSMAR